ncbi:hypothetical protein HK097_007704 [Rhizophlyctis rosea]|uniref:Archaemetzincin-2 n=1 Tax=Rhizophlyctis rosea TaxID=64517 RepID=A0AAD5SKA7_9FUNG|nr:hypothetical protein HK097_007704 [Rhizophlyctis rosea]
MSVRSRLTKAQNATPCEHGRLMLSSSPHDSTIGFVRPPVTKRIAARMPSGRTVAATDITSASDSTKPSYEPPDTSFPAPLVLPGDDLALDPKYPPQTLRMWARDSNRNPITPLRKTVYVTSPPVLSADVDFMRAWTMPNTKSLGKAKHDLLARLPAELNMTIVQHYLEAFFHPLPVKLLGPPLSFTSWEQRKKPAKPSHTRVDIAILTPPSTLTKINHRSRPNSFLFTNQLSMSDLIDALMTSIPSDAHSITMLTQHDMYEDEDDEFICGRAYGGDRVAVVSSARYVVPPGMEDDGDSDGDEAGHQWPASHCWDFVKRKCANGNDEDEDVERTRKKRKTVVNKASDPFKSTNLIDVATNLSAPLPRALSVFLQPPPESMNAHATSSTYAASFHFRVIRTLTHEILHTFGLDHCVYYACLMQGTASLGEDGRIPPYLCPVCSEKLWRAVKAVITDGADGAPNSVTLNPRNGKKHPQEKGILEDKLRHDWMVERYRRMKAVCEQNRSRELGCQWRAFAGWLEGRLEELIQ